MSWYTLSSLQLQLWLCTICSKKFIMGCHLCCALRCFESPLKPMSVAALKWVDVGEIHSVIEDFEATQHSQKSEVLSRHSDDVLQVLRANKGFECMKKNSWMKCWRPPQLLRNPFYALYTAKTPILLSFFGLSLIHPFFSLDYVLINSLIQKSRYGALWSKCRKTLNISRFDLHLWEERHRPI